MPKERSGFFIAAPEVFREKGHGGRKQGMEGEKEGG